MYNKKILIRSLIWMILSIFAAFTFRGSSIYEHNLFVLMNLISYSLCAYNWVKCGGRWSSLFLFFVIYVFTSNMGQSLLYMFHLPDIFTYIYGIYSFRYFVEMLRFQNLCIAGLNLGMVLYLGKSDRCICTNFFREAYTTQNISTNSPTFIERLILIASLAYIFYNCVNMLVMKSNMSYDKFFESGRGFASNIFVTYAKLFAQMYPFYFLYKRVYAKLIIWCCFLYSLIFMLTGARGWAIQYLSILLVMLPIIRPNWFSKNKMILWMIGGIIFFIIIGALSSFRESNLGSTSIDFGSGGMFIGFYHTLADMGFSSSTTVATMRALDMGEPHKQTVLIDLIRAFIPGAAEIGLIPKDSGTLCNWITGYQGITAYGMGYSCIAELFLNWGWFGFIGFLLWGWFIAYAENTAYRRISHDKYLYAIILLSLLSTMIFWARAEFSYILYVIRNGFYLIIIYFLVAKKRI